MAGVSLPLFVAVLKALVKAHGDRAVPWAEMEAIRARVAAVEAIYLESPPAPKKPRKPRAKKDGVSGGVSGG